MIVLGERMELRNLKASFIFKSNVYHDFEKRSYIFKIDNIVFTIYKHSPHLVNVTGLKKLSAIERYRKYLEERFKQKVDFVRIDNTFFSRKQKKIIDLTRLYEYLKNNRFFRVNYNVELFCGMYLHPRVEKMPTLLLFHTGSYIVMGGKNLKKVYKCERFLERIISMFEIMDKNKIVKS